jgi:hypothetical protein
VRPRRPRSRPPRDGHGSSGEGWPASSRPSSEPNHPRPPAGRRRITPLAAPAIAFPDRFLQKQFHMKQILSAGRRLTGKTAD